VATNLDLAAIARALRIAGVELHSEIPMDLD
jgi:hypothetical protein